jgi:hypothetical protein
VNHPVPMSWDEDRTSVSAFVAEASVLARETSRSILQNRPNVLEATAPSVRTNPARTAVRPR